MRILISACLLGAACRYDGGSKACEKAVRLGDRHVLIPVCPEQLGGLATPRPPAENRGDKVVNRQGLDVTEEYKKGAAETLRLYRLCRCDMAVLKARSPSCGCDGVYDGTFSHTLVPGMGVTARMLKEAGVQVISEEAL